VDAERHVLARLRSVLAPYAVEGRLVRKPVVGRRPARVRALALQQDLVVLEVGEEVVVEVGVAGRRRRGEVREAHAGIVVQQAMAPVGPWPGAPQEVDGVLLAVADQRRSLPREAPADLLELLEELLG